MRQVFGEPVASPSRIARALRTARSDVCDWCDLATTPYSVNKLSQAVADQLPALLEVGLAELLVRRWLPDQRLPGPWLANVPGIRPSIDLTVQPCFELLGNGLMHHAVDISAQITLRARSNEALEIERNAGLLHLNNASGWWCKAVLGIVVGAKSGQHHQAEEVAPFAEVEGEIVLPLVIPTRAPYDVP